MTRQKALSSVYLWAQLHVCSRLFGSLQKVSSFRRSEESASKYCIYLSSFKSGVRYEEIRRSMESRFCALNDAEELQTRVSNTENNIHFER